MPRIPKQSPCVPSLLKDESIRREGTTGDGILTLGDFTNTPLMLERESIK